MCVEVRKSTEFFLPQAQVLYISSTNKFILVKATNLSLSPFMPSCTPISSTTIYYYFDLLLIWHDKENNYTGPKFPHGDWACQGWQQTMLKSILTITPMIKYSKFEINIQ